MARKPSTREASPHQGAGQKIVFARKTRSMIAAVAFMLPLIFGVVQISFVKDQLRADALISNINPPIAWAVALSLYYYCWAHGTLFDTNIQELTYVKLPENWSNGAYVVVALLTLGGAGLCWTEGDLRRFSVALLIFIILDQISWLYLKKELAESTKFTEEYYKSQKDFNSLLKFRTVVDSIQGDWRWRKFIVSVALLSLMAMFAYVTPIHAYTLAFTARYLPDVQNLDAVAGGLLVLIWVGILEAWHWYVRIKTKICVNFVETSVQPEFKLTPATPSRPQVGSA